MPSKTAIIAEIDDDVGGFSSKAQCGELYFPKSEVRFLRYSKSTRDPPGAQSLSPTAYRWLHASRLHTWYTKLNFGGHTRANCSLSELLRLRTAGLTFMPTTNRGSPRSLPNQSTLRLALRQSHLQRIRSVL